MGFLLTVKSSELIFMELQTYFILINPISIQGKKGISLFFVFVTVLLKPTRHFCHISECKRKYYILVSVGIGNSMS